MNICGTIKEYGLFFFLLVLAEIILCSVTGALLLASFGDVKTIGAMILGIGVGLPVLSIILTSLIDIVVAASEK